MVRIPKRFLGGVFVLAVACGLQVSALAPAHAARNATGPTGTQTRISNGNCDVNDADQSDLHVGYRTRDPLNAIGTVARPDHTTLGFMWMWDTAFASVVNVNAPGTQICTKWFERQNTPGSSFFVVDLSKSSIDVPRQVDAINPAGCSTLLPSTLGFSVASRWVGGRAIQTGIGVTPGSYADPRAVFSEQKCTVKWNNIPMLTASMRIDYRLTSDEAWWATEVGQPLRSDARRQAAPVVKVCPDVGLQFVIGALLPPGTSQRVRDSYMACRTWRPTIDPVQGGPLTSARW